MGVEPGTPKKQVQIKKTLHKTIKKPSKINKVVKKLNFYSLFQRSKKHYTLISINGLAHFPVFKKFKIV